jgi:hypothetical protein
MKTEDLLRYQAEYRAMQEVLGTFLLVFDFSKVPQRINGVGAIHELPLPQSAEPSDSCQPQLNASPHPKQ